MLNGVTHDVHYSLLTSKPAVFDVVDIFYIIQRKFNYKHECRKTIFLNIYFGDMDVYRAQVRLQSAGT